MKKIIKLIFVLFATFVFLQLFIFIFKTGHEVIYKIKSDDFVLEVKEQLLDDNYYLKIKVDDYSFSFKVSNKYYKQKKIVDDVLVTFNNEDLCIYPVLEKDNLSVICSDKKENYSYEISKNDLSSFISKLDDLGYDIKNWYDVNDNSNTKQLGLALIYPDNVFFDTYIYVWKYDGFYTVSKDKAEQLKIFKNDTYVNDLGILVGKYYVIPDYDQKIEFDKFYIYDVTTNKVRALNLKKKIARDAYFNGIVNDKIYLFDKDNLLQYEINPKKRKIKEIGNKDDDGLYFDKEWQKISIYDLRDKEMVFVSDYSYLEKIVDVTSLKYIYKNDEIYYYLDADDNCYSYNAVTEIKTLLFNQGELSFITNALDDIYFVKDNTLYLYSSYFGTRKVLTYSELEFNTENRIAIYHK